MSDSGLLLQEMEVGDLPMVAKWLAEPHVARWYLAGSSVDREIEDLRQSVAGEQAVNALIVLLNGGPIGWCQWYLCDDDPDWAQDIGARPGDVGMDYAIGSPTHTGRGIGTALIAAMVDAIRAVHPHAAIFADPDERNAASRRVLEKNGFALVDVKSIPSELTADPMAIYRLGRRAGFSASVRWSPNRSPERSR